jgi:DNA-binding response OmpR family regulator
MSRLLLVDDDRQLLGLYRLILEHAGHQVHAAETCRTALLLLVQTDPEIVIMDLRIPETEDGLAIIRTLKNHKRPPGMLPLRVIVISGWTEDLPAGVEREFVDRVLAKPVRMEILLRSVAELAQ